LDVRATLAADPAHEPVLDVGQAKMVRPEIGADPDVVAAMMIPAINQHIAGAGGAHFAEGDFLRMVSGHGRIIKNSALPHEFRRIAKGW
jgi:hypothetical protein